MATYQFFIYSPNALPYDAGSGTFTFDPNYDHTSDRALLTIEDDDAFLDGDEKADEVGEDATQTGTAAKPDGTGIASGSIYAESFAVLEAPDGTLIWIDRIEIEGVHVGYSPSRELDPGVTYQFLNQTDIDNAPGGDFNADNRLTYSEYQAQSVSCFLSGTMLETEDGLMPIDWIGVGDRVRTLDHGWQTVRWRGHREFRYSPNMPRPIEIAKDAFGTGQPVEPIRVSPQHRVLLGGWETALFFGEAEVFVAAKHLTHLPGVTSFAPEPDHAYHHLLFDRHEVLMSDGILLESLFLGENITRMPTLPNLRLRAHLAADHGRIARRCLTALESRVLSAAIAVPVPLPQAEPQTQPFPLRFHHVA